MPDAIDRLLTTREVSELLRVSQITLARWRSLREGPPFQRFGRFVRYRQEQVSTWLDRQTFASAGGTRQLRTSARDASSA